MPVTDAFRRAAFDPETGEVFLVLLTIDHPDIHPPIRVVNNTENIPSRGNEFIAFPFDLQIPDSREDAPPRARLTIDNVSREIALAIRQVTTPPSVLMEIIRAADPDIVEASFPGFVLRDVRWDALQVSGELAVEDLAREPFPAGTFTPGQFPGLF